MFLHFSFGFLPLDTPSPGGPGNIPYDTPSPMMENTLRAPGAPRRTVSTSTNTDL